MLEVRFLNSTDSSSNSTCVYCIYMSPCVGGSKAPPCTLYCINCVLAEQFIQTANYCKKSIFSLPVATVYTSAKPQTAFRGDTNYINHA